MKLIIEGVASCSQGQVMWEDNMGGEECSPKSDDARCLACWHLATARLSPATEGFQVA